MTETRKEVWQGWLAFLAFVGALALPLVVTDGKPVLMAHLGTEAILVILVVGLAVLSVVRPGAQSLAIDALIIGAIAGGIYAVLLLPMVEGKAAEGYWALVVVSWLLAWLLVTRLSAIRPRARLGTGFMKVLVPLLFGVWLLFLWEVIVRGAGVPFVLLPPPSAIWAKLSSSVPTLLADFRQTFLKAVLAGYAIGCASGFVVAIIADRVPFLRRGLLPIGNLVSALPIIGIAPIMVMWFGFDWHSKAAVVAVMTFFPMLVSTLAGLAASEVTEQDLMRTYAAGYWETLFKLRLPAALPFIFNALKINSTLAMIGAIVAEFFGTPVVGMGFRISTEVGRMSIDMVWAEIAVAALAGSAFYAVVALIERASTFWHPSFRQQP